MPVSLFDLGGTLVDSVTTKELAAHEFSKKRGLEIEKQELNALINKLNISRTRTRDLVASIMSLRGIPPSEDDYNIFRDIENSFEKLILPGAVEHLSRLKEKGETLGIVSNGKKIVIPSEISLIIPKNNIFCRISPDIPKKPDPYLYLDALNSLSISPEDTTIYEDTPRGLQSAVSAGIYNCIGVASSNSHIPTELLRNGAKKVIFDYTEEK